MLLDAVAQRPRADRYRWLQDATRTHRCQHRCAAYVFDDGTILTALAHATQARTVIELGTAIGYTACCWADAGAVVDTIDHDREHLTLAAANIGRTASAGTVHTVHGDFLDVLAAPPLTSYDIAFFDGISPDSTLLAALTERVRPGGLLVTTNLALADRSFSALLRQVPTSATVLVDHNLALTALDGQD
jgi:predicted O-methyltransferase YrrM